MSSKNLDLIVFGATGFTGKLVCEYLAEEIVGNKARGNIRVAIAGRSKASLEAVRASMATINDACSDVEILVASVSDSASLDAMTSRTRVLITTVGPYARYGIPVVESCIRQNTDYVDLTGESTFMRKTIASLDAVAKKKKVAIVHTCGYDSIPSDIGALLLDHHVESTHKQRLDRVVGLIGKSRGAASGGTVASMLNMIKNTSMDEIKAAARPDSLVPASIQPRPKEKDLRWARYNPDAEKWTAPWLMEAVNTRVVRRSAALRSGRCFAYTEVIEMPSAFAAYAFAFVYTLSLALLVLPPTRWLLERFVLPAPGQGPSRDTIVNGFFNHTMIAFSDDATAPRRVTLRIKGKRDPGYGATSRMLVESAICLLSRDQCAMGVDGGGILTPASAMGLSLVPHLERAGITFEVVDDVAI